MGVLNRSIRHRIVVILAVLGLSTALAIAPAGALSFDTDSDGVLEVPTTSSCPLVSAEA